MNTSKLINQKQLALGLYHALLKLYGRRNVHQGGKIEIKIELRGDLDREIAEVLDRAERVFWPRRGPHGPPLQIEVLSKRLESIEKYLEWKQA